jgi:hypothetical protein
MKIKQYKQTQKCRFCDNGITEYDTMNLCVNCENRIMKGE